MSTRQKTITNVLALSLLLMNISAAGRTIKTELRAATSPAKRTELGATEKRQMAETLNKLPLYFIENPGWLDKQVAFFIQGADKSLYFTQEGITFQMQPEQRDDDPAEITEQPPSWTLKLDFVNANPNVKIIGKDETPAQMNYFTGNRAQWKTGLKTYGSIVYQDLWPGIDLVYSGSVNRMKYEFVVKPGADPKQIRLAYRGASEVRVNPAGQLDVRTPVASFLDDKPVSWQGAEGHRTDVETAYEMVESRDAEIQMYQFKLGKYDASQTLVIDPVVLVYCGYLGGKNTDRVEGIAVDAQGYAYVTGYTSSPAATPWWGFPVKTGPDLTHNSPAAMGADSYDAFVAKVKVDGSELVYCGFIGGSACDEGHAIAVDNLGRAYVVGRTNSPNFPAQNASAGQMEAFVLRLTPDGKNLEDSRLIGGNAGDEGYGVAVDKFYRAYVAGTTESSAATFPETPGDLQQFGGVIDGFIARVNVTGNLEYCGYLGGKDIDVALAVKVDATGQAYVGGRTLSSQLENFPAKIGPDLTYNGNLDAFVAKISNTGKELIYCGYIGGSADEYLTDLAVHSDGTVVAVGGTESNQITFPVLDKPEITFDGVRDGFVTKIKASGLGLVFSGYLGGVNDEAVSGVVLDGAGNIYVTGYTSSTEASFPVMVGPDLTHNGGTDAFIAQLSPAGTLEVCGYLGGSLNEFAGKIALHRNTTGVITAHIVGHTFSKPANQFPLLIGPSALYKGDGPPLGWEGFVAKIRMN